MMTHRRGLGRSRSDTLGGIAVLQVTVGWGCSSRVAHDRHGVARRHGRLIVLHLHSRLGSMSRLERSGLPNSLGTGRPGRPTNGELRSGEIEAGRESDRRTAVLGASKRLVTVCETVVLARLLTFRPESHRP
jgi:hypothetical protein